MNVFKSKKVRVVLLLLLALVCCVIVGIIGGFLYVFNSNTNVPYVSDLVEKLEKRLTTEDQFKDSLVLAMTSSPTVSYPDSYGLKSDFLIDSTVATENGDTKITLDGNIVFNKKALSLDSSISVELSGIKMGANASLREFINDEKSETFMKVSNLPGFFKNYVKGLDKIEDKWMYAEVYNKSSAADFKTEDFNNLIKSKEFKDLFNRAPDKVFGNVRANCITINANQEQVKALVNKYQEISGKSIPAEFINKMPALTITGDVCIGRRDGQLYLFNINYSSKEAKVSLTIDNFEALKGNVDIEKPTAELNSQDLNSVFAQ